MRKIFVLAGLLLAVPSAQAFDGTGFQAPQVSDETYISNPQQGEIVFNTTGNALKVYNGTSWDDIGASTGGGIEEVDSMIYTSDYTASSPTIGNWYIPSSTFKVTVPSNGDYRVNLKAMMEAITSSATPGNQVLLEFAFSKSSTAGNSIIGQIFRTHAYHHNSSQYLYSTINWTSNTFAGVAGEEIFVHLRISAFSGSPSYSALKLRSESGTGAAIDPILTLTRVGN